MLKMPIIGPILQKAAIARYARTLSTMFAAGVPLVEALESVAGATGNIVYEIGVLRMRDEVATGQRLQQAMENTDLFPNMVIQMIAVGEESGSLDEMSAKVADFYEEDVDNAVDNLSQPARADDHGDPRRAGWWPRRRHVPADLQDGFGHLASNQRTFALQRRSEETPNAVFNCAGGTGWLNSSPSHPWSLLSSLLFSRC